MMPELLPDLRYTRHFIAALTGSSSTMLCFQTLDDQAMSSAANNGDRGRARSELVQTIWGSFDDGETPELLADFNRRGSGIYVTVNQLNDGRPQLDNGEVVQRKAQNVTAIRSLFVDCDGVEPDLSSVPEPSITVRSARGAHHYWLVRDCAITDFKAAQQHLARTFGTDIAVNDPCRVMRLPGYWHRKREPVMVTMTFRETLPVPMSTAQVFATIGGLVSPDRPAPDRRTHEPNARQPGPVSILRSGDGGLENFRKWAQSVDTSESGANSRGGRNKASYDISTEGLGRGIDPADVLQVVLSYCSRSGLAAHEGESTWRSACQRHAESPFRGNAPAPTGRGVIRHPGGVIEIERPAWAMETTAAQVPDARSDLPELAEGDFFPTDTGSADRFAATFEDALLHSPGEGWMVWDGKRWEINPKKAHRRSHLFVEAMLLKAKQAFQEAAVVKKEADAAMNAAQSVIGPASVAAQKQWNDLKEKEEELTSRAKRIAKNAESLNRAHGPSDLLKLAESQPVFCVRESELDADPFLLNVGNGIVDLRLRMLAPHDPEKKITRLITVDYDPAAKCDRWNTFMADIMLDNLDAVTFLQRALGYSLTGSTREQVFFLCIGGGANGKSTMLEVIKHVLGPYANAVEHTTILDQNRSGSAPSADVARLRAARFVTINEMPEGKRMDVNRIKDWTGGDTIVARHLYREGFEFQPAFKMWIRANSEPPFRETDEGTWRRVRVIPFQRNYLGSDKNVRLKEELIEEAPGILRWLVDGAADWFMNGLEMPQMVADATSKYRNALDTLQHFIDEAIVRHPDKEIRSLALYECYSKWCECNGERPMTQTSFSTKMTRKGFENKHFNRGRMWIGIDIRQDS